MKTLSSSLVVSVMCHIVINHHNCFEIPCCFTAPKHPRACLYLEWNPVETQLVGVLIFESVLSVSIFVLISSFYRLMVAGYLVDF